MILLNTYRIQLIGVINFQYLFQLKAIMKHLLYRLPRVLANNMIMLRSTVYASL